MAATLENLSLTDLYFDEHGVVMPNTADVKALVEEVFTYALGESCDFTAETPLGRLVEMMTFIIAGVVRINAQCAGQIDPYHSTGAFLDAVAAFHGVYRKSRTKSVVIATLTGNYGAVVPAGSLASTTKGDVFVLDEDTEIGPNGTAEATFSSQEYGAVPCDAGTLTRIDTAVVGWDGVYNSTNGRTGSDMESDASLRERVVAANDSGVGFVNSIRSAVLAVDGVSSCVVYENGDSSSTVINGVVVSPHSVYICVDGGDNGDVAEAIYRTKPAGCGMTDVSQGSSQYLVTGISTTTDKPVTEATYADDATGASYAMKYYRAARYEPTVRIRVQRWSYAGDDLEGDVKSAIADYVNGLSIGSSLTAFDVGMAVQTAIPTIRILSVLFNPAGQDTEVAVYGYQVPRVTDLSKVIVTIG